MEGRETRSVMVVEIRMFIDSFKGMEYVGEVN